MASACCRLFFNERIMKAEMLKGVLQLIKLVALEGSISKVIQY